MLKTSGSSISAISGDSILEKLLTGRLGIYILKKKTFIIN